MEERVNSFYTLSRKYFMDMLTEIRDKNMEVREQFQNILIRNGRDYAKAIREFETDNTVKCIINELNEMHPFWYIRKVIQEAILRNIEKIVPEEYSSLVQIKKAVVTACREADIDERIHFDAADEIVTEICNTEKQRFYEYLCNISEEDLDKTVPLFYRRVLSDDKASEIEKRMDEIWYNSNVRKEEMLCFKQEDFEAEVSLSQIIDILMQHGTDRIYEINTGGIASASYLMDLSALNPYFADGFNIYWCTDEMDCAIIKDHEGCYFICGEWLVDRLKEGKYKVSIS